MQTVTEHVLFAPTMIGAINVANRIAMAPPGKAGRMSQGAAVQCRDCALFCRSG